MPSAAGGGAGRSGRRRRGISRDGTSNSGTVAASYARFSSDQQRAESNADQQRKCREAADRNGHRILPEFEYADEAVSGTKLRREGLDSLLRDAEAGDFQVLYFHSLSRLARESIISMAVLKRLVYVFKVRIISVSESIDSERDNWEVVASIMSLLHERYIKDLAENVFRGQEGAKLADLCVGDYCFGFTSEPIPGSEKTRKGRNAKPRKRYVVDEVTAPWVLRIFHWFVNERRSLRWITRELNHRGAPKDHRATTKGWHHQQVAGLLANSKACGVWRWGEMKNIRDPETGKIRQEPRPEEECEKWTRQFPHLRIIDDDIFERAQELLEENFQKYAANRRANGSLKWSNRGSSDNPPRHLLSQLIHCEECGAIFHVSGANGKYLSCPNYPKGICACKTTLQRKRAERMILDPIGRRILSDPEWFQAVHEHVWASWTRQEQQTPTELAATERALADVDRKISRLVDRIEDGSEDPNIEQRLEERYSERRALAKRQKQLRHADENRGSAPTEEWLPDRLQQLGKCLNGENPAATYALRALVGGKIVVKEIRREGRKRHHLQGRFTMRSNSVANLVAGHTEFTDSESAEQHDGISNEIVVDFVDPNPLDLDADKAKELYDKRLLRIEIAGHLGCSKSRVTKLLKHWFESRDLVMPDGRSQRATLKKKHLEPPLYQKIADEVMVLYRQEMLLQDIADRLDVDRNTVTAAVRWWHEAHDLPVPDGRARRKELERKVSPKPGTSDA